MYITHLYRYVNKSRYVSFLLFCNLTSPSNFICPIMTRISKQQTVKPNSKNTHHTNSTFQTGRKQDYQIFATNKIKVPLHPRPNASQKLVYDDLLLFAVLFLSCYSMTLMILGKFQQENGEWVSGDGVCVLGCEMLEIYPKNLDH